jgi:RNA polymerase sigma factor (sigma-70 family)
MKPSIAGRAVVWTTAISVSGIDPHAVPIALGAAVAKEAFDLLRARSHRVSVLAYLRAAPVNTYLDIGPSPAAPALVLSVASPGSRRPDDEKGTELMPADQIPAADSGPGPDEFCAQQREDWLAYAFSLTRNWPDAEDAAARAALKVSEHHDEFGTLCPAGRDPVAWSKTIIRNYVIDRHRRSKSRRWRMRALVPWAADIADEVTDQIIARQALDFVNALESRDHLLAVLRWIEGMQPKEIAELLGMTDSRVRGRLSEIADMMRTELGIARPRKVLKEETP